MNVAVVIRRLDPTRGGAEVWTAQLVKRLASDGHTVWVVAESCEVTDPGVRFARVALSTRSSDQRRIEFARRAEELLRRLDVRVIHDQGDGWYFDIFQPHGGTRHLSFEQNTARLPRWLQPLRRLALRALPRYRTFRTLEDRQYRADNTALYVAVSDRVAIDLRRHYGIPSNRIRVIYNGVDTKRFSPQAFTQARSDWRRRLGIGSGSVAYLFVATNFRLKGGPQLLRAFRDVVAKEVDGHLLLVGRTPRWVRPWARWHGLDSRIHLLGPVDDPRPAYAAADVYVHPTFGDACSLVVLEAMAMGLPVITTWNNGAATLVDRFEAGAVIEAGSIRQLTAAMLQASNWDWRLAHSAAAQASRLWIDWEHNYRAILRLYEEVATTRAKRLAG